MDQGCRGFFATTGWDGAFVQRAREIGDANSKGQEGIRRNRKDRKWNDDGKGDKQNTHDYGMEKEKGARDVERKSQAEKGDKAMGSWGAEGRGQQGVDGKGARKWPGKGNAHHDTNTTDVVRQAHYLLKPRSGGV